MTVANAKMFLTLLNETRSRGSLNDRNQRESAFQRSLIMIMIISVVVVVVDNVL